MDPLDRSQKHVILRSLDPPLICPQSLVSPDNIENMKKKKKIKSFYFQDLTHDQMANALNTEFPIDLRFNNDLVERVCKRYNVPGIEKSEIVVIIREAFQAIRDSLVLGKILNFNNLFFDFKLNVSEYNGNGIKVPIVKVYVTTPPSIRKKDV